MERRLYVGNLSYSSSEDDLRSLFEGAGEVASVTIVKDRDTGRSKGFAFVEMQTEEQAQAAINQFHGTSFQNREITVNLARPREERGGQPRGGAGAPRGAGQRGGRGGGGRGHDRPRGNRY